jgi:hypothetical protein
VSALRFARILLTSLLVTSAALGESPPSAAPGASAPSAITPGPAPPLLDIVSDSSCPAPPLVGALLREILGLSSGEHVDEVAHLVREEGLVLVTLRGKDARVLGERRLPGDGSCDELARAVAVVLASWLSDVHPEFVPTVPTPPPLDTPPTALTPTDGAEAPRAEAPPSSGSVTSSGRVVPRGALRWRVEGALGLGFHPTPLAFVGGAGVALLPETSGLGATLRASVSTWRAIDVDGGRALYRRWPLEAGAVLRFAGASVAGELEGGAALGWLALSGRSFGLNRDAGGATFGPFVTARALGSRGTLQPLVELSSVYWARVTRVYGDPARPSTALPNLELSLSVGVAVLP